MTTDLIPDYWAWVEPDEARPSVEPGLRALQSRPQLATGQRPHIVISRFDTSASTASGLAVSGGVAYPATGFSTNFPPFGGGIGNWDFDKNRICWIYVKESSPSLMENYIAIADTSYRPVGPPTVLDDVFTHDLHHFFITGAIPGTRLFNIGGIGIGSSARFVPPFGKEISFLGRREEQPTARRNLYLIDSYHPTGSLQEINAADFISGGESIAYVAWSADGSYLFLMIDDRFVIYNRLTNSVVLNVVDSPSPGLPQFTDDGSVLYYTKNNQLMIRREASGFGIDETADETGTFTCEGTHSFRWQYPKRSPDGKFWLNIFRHVCGGPFAAQYRSFIRIRDEDLFLVRSLNASSFASGFFFGDFTNDSRWFIGGDGNINGNSLVTVGPAPDWDTSTQGGSLTGNVHIRSFQAW